MEEARSRQHGEERGFGRIGGDLVPESQQAPGCIVLSSVELDLECPPSPVRQLQDDVHLEARIVVIVHHDPVQDLGVDPEVPYAH